jgi:Holliday junction resolvase RusA-like endonuclease
VNPLQRITFTVEGVSVPKGRPRFAKSSGGVRTYTPAATRSYETLVKLRAKEAAIKQKWVIGKDDVCTLHLMIFRQHLIKGGDGDNVLKAVADACNGVLYTDDCRVVGGSFEIHEVGGERPEVQVTCERFSRRDWS